MKAFVITLLLVVAAGSTAWAQVVASGRIAGRASDDTGGVLPGVKVTLITDRTSRTTVTDDQGRFAFEDLPAENAYDVLAALAGFRDVTTEGLHVWPGETTTADFVLSVGCIVEYQIVERPPLDQLLKTDAVVHLRVIEDSRRVIVREGDCPRTYHYAPAVIVDVAASARSESRQGASIPIVSERPLQEGAEYLGFLNYGEGLQRFWLGSLSRRVIDGRVDWYEEAEILGFRGRTPIDRALARIRELRTRHTRYRRYGDAGTEAPLETLRYKTGWFELGGFRRNEGQWFEHGPYGTAAIARPFEFVGDPLSSRAVPRPGDRIRLYRGGRITIMDFGSRGEALRTRRPNTWRTLSDEVTITGTRVDAGGVYAVADVVVWTFEDDRFISVRLVAD